MSTIRNDSDLEKLCATDESLGFVFLTLCGSAKALHREARRARIGEFMVTTQPQLGAHFWLLIDDTL